MAEVLDGDNNNKNRRSCASCTFSRKKCPAYCVLAPYFPLEKNEEFLKARSVFGVAGIKQLLEGVADPSLRQDVTNSLVFEAELRLKDPVNGCYGLVQQLKAQYQHYIRYLLSQLQSLARIQEAVQLQPQLQTTATSITTTPAARARAGAGGGASGGVVQLQGAGTGAGASTNDANIINIDFNQPPLDHHPSHPHDYVRNPKRRRQSF